MAAERVVRVLPDVPAVSRTFDYLVPALLDADVRVGTEVRIKLHGRRVGGWVVEDQVEPAAGIELQPLLAVRGWGPPPEVVELANWAAWRWAGPASSFLRSASSLRAVRSLPAGSWARPSDVRRDSVPSTNAGRRDRDCRAEAELFAGGTVVVRRPPGEDLAPLAFAASGRLDEDAGSRSAVLVLAPVHDAASEIADRLRHSGRRVALLPQDWAHARAGGCVVVGTRAAALAPVPRLAAALVLDSHEESYHEQRTPSWCAWEIVVERAKRDLAPCVLASPCPTLDLLRAGQLVTPSRGAERVGWPVVEVVDRSAEDPRSGLFSARVVALVRWAAERQGRRVLCVLNRTGRVRLMSCTACRELARCEICSGPLEQLEDLQGPRLRCRRCGEERPVVCARCGAGRMKALRIGVTRVREELEALVGTEVEEVWGRPSAADARSFAPSNHARVAVGTEALLYRGGSADAVVFLDFDAELLAPRMRASEEALALLARASRVVARSSEIAAVGGRAAGRLVVQTRVANHEVLNSAVSADPGRLSSAEEVVRRALELPPFSALAHVSGAEADSYCAALRECAPAGTQVTGPTDGVWWVKAPHHEDLCDLLAKVRRPRGRLRVVVDPVLV